jgi:hypothetical protein
MSDKIDDLAYLFWSVHPRYIDEWEKTAPKMPEGYKGGMRAWFFACEIRKLVEFDSDCATADAVDLTDMNTEERLRWKEFVPIPRSTFQRVEAAVEGNVLWRFWRKRAQELAVKKEKAA